MKKWQIIFCLAIIGILGVLYYLDWYGFCFIPKNCVSIQGIFGIPTFKTYTGSCSACADSVWFWFRMP